ncbi:hypothetical protein EPIB2_785 [Tritonibacter mobilis]|uniref:hypothetical protein n=1 Tax=Tritonibacter mobilis TaxID=379347 RepID=UPI000F6BC711|nr:hypothetical protein [Tritonibacter mobilis]VCU61708.1 hypothetical protein EPIB2_785 [Tritonibacter mobilis]
MQQECQKFEGHVYLDISNPFVAWNVSRGTFASADILHANGGFSEASIHLSPWSEALFRPGNESKLAVEFNLEAMRREHFPKEVSRLTGIFLFACIEDVAALWETKGWGAHFEDSNLADVGVQAIATSKLDANWMPKLVRRDGTLASDWQAKARAYWSGESAPNGTPIWETIVSGGVSIWGTDLKVRELAKVKESYPQSETARCYSEMAFDLGSLDGIIAPVAVLKGDSLEIEGRFRFVDGASRGFREALSRGVKGCSGRTYRFPEDLEFAFPPIMNAVSREPSYRVDPLKLMRSSGLL